MELTIDGSKLRGTPGRDQNAGSDQNGRIEATAKPNKETTIKLDGRLNGDRITGTAEAVEGTEHVKLTWEAKRATAAPASARTHTFEPTQFHHHFSSSTEPALHINSGD